MVLTREVVGALSHAELVALVVEQSRQIEAQAAMIADLRALVATLEARIRDLEQQLAQRDRDGPTKRMPGLKPAATPRPRGRSRARSGSVRACARGRVRAAVVDRPG